MVYWLQVPMSDQSCCCLLLSSVLLLSCQGNHIPLPPMVFVAFLCIYAGFQLGEPRGGAQVKPVKQKAGGQQQNGQQQKQQAGSSKGTPQKTSKGTQNRKQRKQA